MPRILKRRFEFTLVLAVVALVVVWNAGPLDTTPANANSPQVPYEQAIEQWAVLNRQAGDALYLGKPERALRYLEQAELLALEMPAGDERISETYDDMGHAYYRLGRLDEARDFQGRAVASRLLVGGPKARDLELFKERYEQVGPPGIDAYRFVGMHRPYTGDRWRKELANLIYRYQVAGDQAAVDYLSRFGP